MVELGEYLAQLLLAIAAASGVVEHAAIDAAEAAVAAVALDVADTAQTAATDATEATEANESAAAAEAPAVDAETPATGARVFRWLAMPFVLYEPETSVQFGAVAGVVWRPESFATLEEASTTGVSAIYTLRKQISVDSDSSIFLADGLWQVENDSSFQIYRDDFWGVGPDAYGESESFAFHGVRTDSSLIRKMMHPWYVALEHRLRWYEVDRVEEGGRLDTGAVVGAASDVAHGLGISGLYDSRDNKASATRGVNTRVSALGFPSFLGSHRQFARFELDARGYVTLPWEHVLANQITFQGNTGSPGFQSLARLGGAELMRGVYEGRWRDRLAWTAQTEYRAHLFWRFGAVAFFAVGDVAPDFAGFGPEPVKWAGGGGLRLALSPEEGVYGRADVGYTPREVGVYVAIGQAF